GWLAPPAPAASATQGLSRLRYLLVIHSPSLSLRGGLQCLTIPFPAAISCTTLPPVQPALHWVPRWRMLTRLLGVLSVLALSRLGRALSSPTRSSSRGRE